MGISRTSPTPSPRKKPATLQHLFSLDTFIVNATFPLDSPTSKDNDDYFLSLISTCTRVFTFTDPSESPSQHDLKRHRLLHILSLLRTNSIAKSPLNDDPCLLSPLISMISSNLFRPLPPPSACDASSPFSFLDDEFPTMSLSPSWPHLNIVYDILTALITNSSDPKSLPSLFDRSFLLNLLNLFQSEDPRERDRLKNVYHLLYSKMTGERSFMRKAMGNTFMNFVAEGEKHCGIGELLEIWGSIINGFTLPLKEEHKVFLVRVLMPLHKPKGMAGYHRQLSYCVTQFVEKEGGVSGEVVKGLMRYWPVTNCQKEVLLIGEVEDLVEVMEGEEFEKVGVVLCTQIAKCLTSCNSQVINA